MLVWTGTAMNIWGGFNNFTSTYYLTDGARYNPTTDTWRRLPDVPAPWSGQYQFTVAVRDATAVQKSNEVRIAGVPVGRDQGEALGTFRQ